MALFLCTPLYLTLSVPSDLFAQQPDRWKTIFSLRTPLPVTTDSFQSAADHGSCRQRVRSSNARCANTLKAGIFDDDMLRRCRKQEKDNW